MARKDNIVVGLDIGTTKIVAIVGEVTHEGIDIIGIGQAPSKGLRKGVVINIASTVESIQRAVEEAELMAGCEITSVYTGISGGHIRGFNSHGIVAVKEGEIHPADVARVIDAAKAVAIPMDREVIHILPQEFIIDDQDGIKEPEGMHGVRLEAKVHIVTAAATSAQNIIKCANRTGLDVQSIVLQQLASAEAVRREAPAREVVTRVSTSGGQHWGINVGRYSNRYQAEKVLLRTALAEMSTLDGSLRKVVQSPRGFDANFMGMSREHADLACRRLQARNVTCFMIGPS